MTSWIEQLQEAKARVQANAADPWREKLIKVRGKIWGDDGIERVTTRELLDLVGVTTRGRKTGACRRIAEIMKSLGWEPTRKRGLTPTGMLDQVRGWARVATAASGPGARPKGKPALTCPHCGGAL